MSSILETKSPSVIVHTSDDLSHLLTFLSSASTTQSIHLWSLTIRSETLSENALQDLCNYLRYKNANFTRLDLSTVYIGDQGVYQILKSIHQACNSPIRCLFLSNVGMSSKGAQTIAPILTCSLGELQYINLSNNYANSKGVGALNQSKKIRKQSALSPLELDVNGNLVTVEIFNSLTHIVGALGAFCGGIFLTRMAILYKMSAINIFALLVYAFSLFFLMAASATYHACFRYPYLSKLLRKADHCGIFVLIAGSYTPFFVFYLLNGESSSTSNERAVLIAVWICGLIGICRSVLGVDSASSRAFFALATGWIGLVSYRKLMNTVPTQVMNLIILGGIAYSIGIIFYLVGKKIPVMHVIWHLAVIVGGYCHYTALWESVVYLS